MAASWRVVPRHLFSDALRVRPVQVKALPSNLSFSTKTRLLALSALTTIYVNFARSNDVRCRCQPGWVRTQQKKTSRNRPTKLALPGCYLGWVTFANNKNCQAEEIARVIRHARHAHLRNPLRRASCPRSKIQSARGSCSALRGRNNIGTTIAL